MNSNGITPTIPLSTGSGFGFGNDGIWALLIFAMIFNNGFGGWGNNGFNNLATQDFVSSEFTQRDINSGFQNTNNLISGGFADLSTNLCNVRSDILTGNMGLQNSILSSSNAVSRDILSQTNELNTNLLTSALQNQAKMDECCCNLRAQGIENTQKILDVLNQNTIDDLRSQVNDLKNTITANGIGASIVNQVRPYPVPSYLVSSPYQSLYNGYSNWYGNTII